MRTILPHGAVRLLEFRSRFRQLGFSPSRATMAALSRPMREALQRSRIEHLPPELRPSLGKVVDVGANTGQWIRALCRFVKPRLVEAFEPNPEAAAQLERWASGFERFRVHRVALGDRSGNISLNVTRASALASVLEPSPVLTEDHGAAARVERSIEVPVARLDDVLHDQAVIDILKLDVQGFEMRVLEGARSTLGRTRSVLIEANLVSHYSGDTVFHRLAAFLEAHGFQFWDMAPPERGVSRRARWADVVFVNEKLKVGAQSAARPRRESE